jgi:indolepyruvate ferredoxin oxidoreductase beta subunit
MKYDVLITGVGGQGVLLASRIIAETALKSGFQVKMSETRGMACVGGPVTVHVRFGDRVYWMLIPRGQADMLLALEPLEGLRQRDFLSPNGTLVANSRPIPVSGYPSAKELEGDLCCRGALLVDCVGLAIQSGWPPAQLAALLGAASNHLPLKVGLLRSVIRRIIPRRADENITAFDLGRSYSEKMGMPIVRRPPPEHEAF